MPQVIEFPDGTFPGFRALVAQDRAINATATAVAMAASAAYSFDARYQRGDDSALNQAVETFAFTPAMCRSICAAPDDCDTAHVSVTRRTLTCFASGENVLPPVAPNDTEAAFHGHLTKFAKWLATADRAVAGADETLQLCHGLA